MHDHHQYCTGGFSPDDIVISGIAGRFPECKSLEELKEGLLNHKNFLIPNNLRYDKGAADVPCSSCGTINEIDKFDADFFGYTVATANNADPNQRLILEVSYEAIADAGYEPTVEFKGANIGVYTAVTNDDASNIDLPVGKITPAFGPGHLRCMNANRVSHVFDFHGPSFTLDAACSSGLVALWAAFNDMKEGRVDAAIVNAGELVLSPVIQNLFNKVGILSPTSESKPFDKRANGIVRTEATTALFIQRASVARRVYATIVEVQHQAAGFVPEGIYVPSFKQESELFKNVMFKTKIDSNVFQFIEAHGTGTKVGDPIELRAIADAFCVNRDKPLYVGSVKSNLGHSEAAAGQTGTIKAIFAFESGLIAPNMDFKIPNPDCKSILDGSIKIVTEPLPLTCDYIPVNSFGFGGSIVHAIYKRNPIEYPNTPEPPDLPRLVLYPATTKEAVLHVFEYVENHPDLRAEFFALLNKLSFSSTLLKPFRGYVLFQNNQLSGSQIKNSLRKNKRQIWFVMTSMGCQWPGMGLDMMQIKIFADSMRRSAAVLKPLGLDLFELLKEDEVHLLTNRSITPAFVCITAIQIALIDVLRALEINPDGIIGHSTGEIACAYADGCCTAEQTLLCAYCRGKSVENADLVAGEMAAVGLTWEEALKRCPKGVYPVCHNASDSITISGLKEPLESFVAELQQENVFARIVNAYGYAFHCEYVWPASNTLRKALSNVIPEPQSRTKRWISTSYPEDKWSLDECKMAGPDYFVNNLMSTVRFHDVMNKIPSDSIIIEIGPHFLLQSILKRTIGKDATYIGLMKKNFENNIGFFLESMGKLYLEGVYPKIEKLYRPVKFPVPRNTPMICDLIKWDHSQSFHVPIWKPISSSFTKQFVIDSTDRYLLDHFIDGRALFPATGYIYLAWMALAKKLQKDVEDIDVIIEDFKILRPTFISPTTISFSVNIFDGSGNFEIMQNNSLVSNGKVHAAKKLDFCEPSPELTKEDTTTFVSGSDIYNEIRIHGYEYGPAFRKLVEVCLTGEKGFVEWSDKWITFMDALLLFYMFSNRKSAFLLPTGIHAIKISPKTLRSGVEDSLKKGLPGLPVNFHADSKICRTVGMEIVNLSTDVAPQQIKQGNCIFEKYKFVPYVHKHLMQEKFELLKKYKIACNKLVDNLESNLNRISNHGKFELEQTNNFDALRYFEESENKHFLLETLKELEHVQNTPSQIACKDIFNRFIENIGKDFINTLLVNDYCLKLTFDIIAENSYRKINILEINNNFVTILPTVVNVVEKFSLLKFKTRTIACKNENVLNNEELSKQNIQLCSCDVSVLKEKERSQGVVISSICISTTDAAQEHLNLLSTLIEPKGFIILFHKNNNLPPENLVASVSGETISIVPQDVLEKLFEQQNLLIISRISDGICGSVYLLRHAAETVTRKIIRLSNDASWLSNLQEVVREGVESAWVVSECISSGIIGMINCLRNEPGGDKIRCVFMPKYDQEKNDAPLFSLEDNFFQDILRKDLVMNVYKDGTWGSYRHIRTEKELSNVEVDNSYVDIKKYGDLSTFMWIESPLKYKEIPSSQFVHIYYSALNFKDVMLASGKLSEQIVKENETDKCLIGIEYSGKTKYGERVAGMVVAGGLGTATKMIPELSFVVPEEWSLEEAATVPVVYISCFYALIVRANLQVGESILIHSGTGGVGQAAINIALSMDCEIYTTVGTEEKRQYLLKNFPQIKPENIGFSRDTSFEQMITKRTNGKGVDVVLNSLAGEKFLASIRCVAKNGRFVEIGKYDMAIDRKIGLKFFLNNITFHAVIMNITLLSSTSNMAKRLMGLLRDGIKTGVVKPLNRVVFQKDEVEKAFRFMGTGTHIGKVLIKIRDEERQRFLIPTTLRHPAIPITYFYPRKVYIIIGGLGGFGIEVTNWLFRKGAKNVILTTRYGSRTPYHHFCLKRWKDEGHNVIVSMKNVSFKDQAFELLKEARDIGPIGGIFNSAVVLHDGFLENTDWEKFREVCAPKADATENLDALSREMCPELDHFVCFSSISCGKGNAGQMNYGYANSVMERICEKRKADGLPGIAIQWGIIGDVGVVHRHMGDDAMIAGVVAQRVKSCLDILDLSCQQKEPVVCSYVVGSSSRKAGELGDPLQQLARIFGLKDSSELNPVRTLGEMGVDSMVSVEVKNLLESTCDTSLTIQEIQELKIDDIKSLIEKAENERKKSSPSNRFVSTINTNLPSSFYHSQPVQLLNDMHSGTPTFIIDIDCLDLTPLRKLAVAVNAPVYALLMTKDTPMTDGESLATWYLERMHEITKEGTNIIAYSSSTVLAFEMMIQDQKMNQNILNFTIMDGYKYLSEAISMENVSSESDILCKFVAKYIPSAVEKVKEELSIATTLEQKTRCIIELFTMSSTQTINNTELTGTVLTYLRKEQLLEKYKPQEKLNKDLLLLEDSSVLLANDVAEVKKLLSEVCTGTVTIHRIPDLIHFNEVAIQKTAVLLNTAS